MKARIPEFDYIRGIAMIMVVMGHVLLFSFHINNSALLAIISICEMPLFFTVSGYLSHKEKVETVSSTLYRLILRSRALLVPLVVWSLVLNVVQDNIMASLSMFYRGGYWFFLALWWCDILNAMSNIISKKCKFGMIADMALYAAIYSLILLFRIKNIELGGILPIHNVQYYFPFFVLGLMMCKHKFISRFVLNKYNYAIGLALLLVGWYFSAIESFVIWFVAALGAVVVIWMICKEINPNNRAARLLGIVGMNTLPIYAIHYLFIVSLPLAMSKILQVQYGFFLQLIVALIFAFMAIGLCLLIDRIISYNHLLECCSSVKKRNESGNICIFK